ncbi:MAG: ABC transporter substrate-binding protein, partial [Nitrososphaerales archaeon]
MARVYDEDALLRYFERYRVSRRGLVQIALTGGIGVAIGASTVYFGLLPQANQEERRTRERVTQTPGTSTIQVPQTVTPGKIVIAIQDDLQSLSPLDWPIEGAGASALMKNFYETFTTHQRDVERFGRMKRLPVLAHKVEPVGDFRTIRVFLRDGVRFHNGSKLTVEAIKPSLDAYGDSRLLRSFFRDVIGVEVLDDLTADIKWERNSIDNFSRTTHL